MRRRAADAAIWVAAAGGALCIVATAAALALHLTLVMFATGSMAPTMPTGTLALVQRVPVGEVRVGEVVTVDRPGLPPITHRIVSSAPTPGADGHRTLVLRGDANRDADPTPYVVASVRVVRWWMPGAAYAVAWITHPLALAIISVAAATLVTWAFWPRRRAGERSDAGAPGAE